MNVEATVHITPSYFCDVTYQLVLTMSSSEAIELVGYQFVLQTTPSHASTPQIKMARWPSRINAKGKCNRENTAF